jgi:hypothetical protein
MPQSPPGGRRNHFATPVTLGPPRNRAEKDGVGYDEPEE